MKITLYTIKDCTFSKQEKEYLNTNKLVFEEKDLETNKDFLTEMLAISNNFAGTPVTRVEKDDGSIAILKGFTKEEFDTTFGLVPVSSDKPVQPTSTDSTVTPPINDTSIPPVVEAPPAPAVENPQPVNPLTSQPNNDSQTNPDPLKSVMDDLQSKSEPVMIPTEQPTSPPSVDPTVPSIPDFPAK